MHRKSNILIRPYSNLCVDNFGNKKLCHMNYDMEFTVKEKNLDFTNKIVSTNSKHVGQGLELAI